MATLAMPFAGKYTLASDAPGHPTVFATPSTLPDSSTEFPAMAAPAAGPNETWIAYAADDGVILQMGDLQYLAQEDAVGTVLASADLAEASRFQWAAEAPGSTSTTLSISVTNRGWEVVRYGINALLPEYLVYAVDNHAPPPGSFSTFTRTTVTPSLAVIQATRNAVGCDLRLVDLTAADLTGVDLSRADLTGATLDGAQIVGGSLAGATLVGASLHGTNVTGTVLDGAVLDGTDISTVEWGPGSSAVRTSFKGCIGVSAQIGSASVVNWSHADLTGADLSHADLSNVNLSGAQLERCVLVGATLQTTNLSGAVLGGVTRSAAADLSYAFLTNVNFDKANCFGVSFAFASVFGGLTNLTETITLEQADFANAYLEGIDLSGAVLRGSRFDNACLVGARLTTADLTPTSDGSTVTSLAGACLHGAQFTQARLESVDFTGATVSFDHGSLDVRYCNAKLGLVPAPPDYFPMHYSATSGLDATTLQPTTVCPNGTTFAANQRLGHAVTQMLTVASPATTWVPVGCAPPAVNPQTPTRQPNGE